MKRREVAFLFDLDGTLADGSEAMVQSLRTALSCCSSSVLNDHALERYIGSSLTDTFLDILPDSSYVDLAVKKFREAFEQFYRQGYRLYPGVKEMLQSSKEVSDSLWVVTAKPKPYAQEVIKALGLESFFEEHVIAPPLERESSDKIPLIREILQRTQLSPENVFMLGDRIYDIQAAHKLGVWSIAATWGYGELEEFKDADYLVDSPEEFTKKIIQERIKKTLYPDQDVCGKQSSYVKTSSEVAVLFQS